MSQEIMLKRIVSFGFRHDGSPTDKPNVVVIDIRRMFNNPYKNLGLRQKKGTDPEVQKEILRTPNFTPLYEHLLKRASAPGIEEVYVGCQGGHHRSVYIAELLGKDLKVPVVHRDIDKA